MTRSVVMLVCALALLQWDAFAQDVLYLKDRSFGLPSKDAPESVREPLDVAVGPDGSLHILDGRGKVAVFSETGVPQRTYGLQFLSRPVAIAVSPTGEGIVLDGQKGKVLIFGPEGQLRTSFGGSGERPGAFGEPVALARGPAGRIYILDAERKGVLMFSGDGLFIRQILVPDLFQKPASLAVGPDGSIYVGERTAPGLLYKLPPFDLIPWGLPFSSGQVAKIPIQGGASGNLVSITVSPGGTLVVLDADQGKLFRRRPDAPADPGRNDYIYGGLGNSFGSFERAAAAAFATADEVVVLDSELRKVERIRLAGEADMESPEPVAAAVRVSYGNPKEFPGVLAALDCDSSGVRGFFYDLKGKSVLERKAEPVPFRTFYGDSAVGFLPLAESAEIAYGQTLSSVGAVAVRDTLVAVTDPDKDRVVVLRKTSGSLIGTFGDAYRDDRRFRKPQGITISPGGRILIADFGSDRVRSLSPDLASVTSVAYTKPLGIAADAADNVFVWSRDGTRLSRIAKGKAVAEEMGGAVFPARVGGLAFDSYGNGFVLDAETQMISVVDREAGSVLFTFGPAEAYEEAAGLFVDPAGNLYMPDRKANATHVYHWSVHLPAPEGLEITYHADGARLTWIQNTSKYLWGYDVCGQEASGEQVLLGRVRESRFDVRAPEGDWVPPKSVTVSPVAISGTRGEASAPVALPGLAALAAYRRNDPASAAAQASNALADAETSGPYKADSAAVAIFRLAAFLRACDGSDPAAVVAQGALVAGAVPEVYRVRYHRCMTFACFSTGKRDRAAQELMALAESGGSSGALVDSGVVAVTFGLFDAAMASGDTTGAVSALNAFTALIPDSVKAEMPGFTDRAKAAETRARLGRGLALWSAGEYKPLVTYCEAMLQPDGVQLNRDESVLLHQLRAVSYFALDKKKSAKAQYLKTFEVMPDFTLESEAAEARRLYGLELYSPEADSFFRSLRP